MTWIEHPTMPGRPVEVPDSAVPHYRSAGWVVVNPPAKPVAPALMPVDGVEQTPPVEGQTTQAPVEDAGTESPKRRRTSPKEDS